MTTQKRAELEEKYFGKRDSFFGDYWSLGVEEVREAIKTLRDAETAGKWIVPSGLAENLDDLVKGEVGTLEEVKYDSTTAAEPIPGWKASMLTKLLDENTGST